MNAADCLSIQPPCHQVNLIAGVVDMVDGGYGEGNLPSPWLVRAIQTKATYLGHAQEVVEATVTIHVLIQGKHSVARARRIMQHGDSVQVRGSILPLSIPTGGEFNCLGLLAGALYPLQKGEGDA